MSRHSENETRHEHPSVWVSLFRKKEMTMKRILLAALISSFAIGTAAAQSCASRAVGAHGKPLHGAAKTSFINKCKQDSCASRAVGKDGKPLHGAAKNSFMAKCKATA
jgi:hypothetical protein